MFDATRSSGLLIDTNLLILFTVGTVNRNRIEQFKRTRQYTRADYELLVRVLAQFKPLYTVAHVLAEVSNLTDLSGSERLQARHVLREMLSELDEAEMQSVRAAEHHLYPKLGLTDAAIAAVARDLQCAVLTDDLDLYLSLSRYGIDVFNFTHVRESVWASQQRG